MANVKDSFIARTGRSDRQATASDHRQFSRFEFWPLPVIYLPVVVQWLALAIRHRSLMLPLLANPLLPLGGMVGMAKSTVFHQAREPLRGAILPWFTHLRSAAPLDEQVRAISQRLETSGIAYPLVCKPNIGCRGAGVRLLQSPEDLRRVLMAYPEDARIVFQQRSRWVPEAGVFYARSPDQRIGRILSLGLKHLPMVVGDGNRTLRQLIADDPRAGQVSHFYHDRLADRLDTVIPKGESVRLLFAASHCRGAVFRNGSALITPQLTAAIDKLMAGLPEFHYGRLDVKFRDETALRRGETLEIVEINGVSAEPLHIWDRNASLRSAVETLLAHYRLLFRLGDINRQRGYSTPPLASLLRAWLRERRLTRGYPPTD